MDVIAYDVLRARVQTQYPDFVPTHQVFDNGIGGVVIIPTAILEVIRLFHN